MRSGIILLTAFVASVLMPVQISAQSLPVSPSSSPVDDFMKLRFGMFIHWGPVTLRGTEIGWSRGHQVPVDDYDNLYREFNPVLFDAGEWAAIAREAGMKYMVITSKHHDGFCLWPSDYTDYDIMSTPFKRDILKELADACRANDIKFCVYFSILDWHDPDYPVHNDGREPDPGADMGRFVNTVKNELREIITRYDPYMLWFDGQWESPWTDEMGADIYRYLKVLKPDLVINNRLGKEMSALNNDKADYSRMIGDFDTPEQRVGKFSLDFPWESCITMCKQWAWKPNDTMKSLDECISTLVLAASGGGNLLFNVGPMPDGRIELRQQERLREMGEWLAVYGESIYGTSGGPYVPSASYSSSRKGNRIFLHLRETPDGGMLDIPPLKDAKVTGAALIGGKELGFSQTDKKIRIELPVPLPDPLGNVVVLTLDRDADLIPVSGK